MALKLGSLKLPFGKRAGTAGKANTATAAAPSGGLPFLGRLQSGQQLQILIGILVFVLMASVIVVVIDARQGTFGTAYVAAVGKIRMLSQRLAKAAQLASRGSEEAFKQLRSSRDEFEKLIKLLDAGDASVDLPPAPAAVRPTLDALNAEWTKTDRNAGLVLEEEKNLVALGSAVRAINNTNQSLQEVADEIAAMSVQSGGSARQNAIASQLTMMTQRMAKNANTMLAENVVDPEVAFLLGKDTNTFRDTLQALLQGSPSLRITRVEDADMRAKLAELQTGFAEYQKAVNSILGNQARLVGAKRASFEMFNDSEALLQAAEKLGDAFEQNLAKRRYNFIALVVLGAIALALLFLIGRVYLDDSRRRAAESEKQNKDNQEAILQLLDEIGNLAGGDLTVRAKVTEAVTGAIADSINYTVDELRRLVTGINSAAQQVTAATQEAEAVTSQLLQAAQSQATEIQGTSQSIAQMTVTMQEVSKSATDSAGVAKISLQAAEKGTGAVQNAIRGMNDIREQIQETSKRIKRLGESSQEIGEIVQLISDITEQTNVLALNAAIQAASAGEAGRGFTVVAEEVQRLAERSGEATKHIGAIVKSIQRDTQDAVEAMERSTRGVVDGAKVADEAGDALREIGQVSGRLAQLIGSISTATQQQAASAAKVATNMKAILAVTQLTTEGTKKTAGSAARLTALADGLKNSVAGFKLN